MATVTPINRVDPLKLNRLLQLCSANLPVGGFSFSQGLEFAVEKGWVDSAQATQQWITLNLTQTIGLTDVAIINRLFKSLVEKDSQQFIYWNDFLLASRESYEFHMADLVMGKALVRLLTLLDGFDSDEYADLLQQSELSFTAVFAIAAHGFKLDLLSSQSGYCWTYIDNQVAAATKLVPLGQTQSQNLLFELTEKVEQVVQHANLIEDDEIGASLPHLTMASAWHENQYTRLFRS